MDHVLVTGGAGFLGSHVCDLLLGRGHKVTAMDNLITGNVRNIAHNVGNPNFRFVKYDVTNYLYLDEHVDAIFHFASPASPIDYQQYPIPTLKVGALGTHKALGLALSNNAVFLLASTSEVYGDPLIHPQKEDYWGNVNPIGPRGVYDEAKRFAEALTMAYHNAHGVDTRICRIFNTFGPRMRLHDGRAVPEMIYQALTGQPITVFGDGSQTRSFCYVSDEVEGIYRLFKSGCIEPVNIGSPVEMTVLEIAETIKRLTKGSSEIVFRPLPVDDPTRRQPDIGKARKLLDWEPKISLEEGLRETIEYIRASV
jgi:dTDP-glucose 4,6-dehydratase